MARRRKVGRPILAPELSPAQLAYLRGVLWHSYTDPALSDDRHVQFLESSRLCWLELERVPTEAMPDGSATARALIEQYRDEALAAWIRRRPFTRPGWWWRHVASVEIADDENEVEYLSRHSLLSPIEIKLAGR